jgi:acetyltransferase-like isoleucine patch superfamily enzyme
MRGKYPTLFEKILKWFMYLPFWNDVMKLLIYRYVIYGDKSRFKLSNKAIIQNAIINVMSGNVIIEDEVFFGHNACLLTGSHDYTKYGIDRRTTGYDSGRDIIIKSGVWLATNVTVIGPCVIGENAVVASGSVVTKDVPAYTIVAGVPAKVIKILKR